jgi:hypothetical protein
MSPAVPCAAGQRRTILTDSCFKKSRLGDGKFKRLQVFSMALRWKRERRLREGALVRGAHAPAQLFFRKLAPRKCS